ncbi:hypothetical protein KRR26_28835 [Corallococcus sp. M34]|uniref:condensation domain-containing protein n=1 Tax=Citreicoccus inhibens TaxID=2849499 RepID=UPI001C24AB94|nr:condensation domain-containing protein [Citreicoccus inhibens]MBU8899623.1 hypothetical protein [Citreicoccus inhibens]
MASRSNSMRARVAELLREKTRLWELAELYQAFASGTTIALAPLPMQYPDYTAWQRQWLQGDGLQSQLAYWRQRLDPEAILGFTCRPHSRSH